MHASDPETGVGTRKAGEVGWPSSPIITSNWEARGSDHWTVPVGGGVGKLSRVGKLPINTKLDAYYNAEKPKFGPNWLLRFEVQFLLPDF